MRIEKTLRRLGGVAVAAAVVTAAAPAAAGHAGPTPSPTTAASPTVAASTSPGTTTASPTPSATPTHRTVVAAAGAPDLAAAATYLATTTGADGFTGGTSLATDGYYELFGGFADFGLTMDGVLALAAAHSDPAALAKAVTFLRTGTDGSGRTTDSYTGYGTSSPDGGALAKEALVAEVTGYDPRAFAGHDLIAALDASRCTAADAATQCAGAGAFEGSATTFSQALAVIAELRASDDTAAGASLAYLEGQQHTDGSFSSDLPAGTDEDPDSTGMAAMALALVATDPAAAGGQRAAAAAAVGDALAWLASDQGADGGWTGAAGDSTNSAALALQALDLDRNAYAAPIAKATAFLGRQQDADGGFDIAAGGTQPGSDVRATTQVVGGLVGTSLGTLTNVVAGYAAATGSAPRAAAWLVTQLTGGDHLTDTYAGTVYDDYGGTADIAIALASTGTQDTTLAAVLRYLEANGAAYADPDGTLAPYPGPYSGAVGKLALVAEITGQDPSSFGGFDLLTTLTSHVCAAADTTGDCTAAGDFSQAYSSVSQAIDVLALERAGVVVPPAALVRLLSLQCPDGGFSSTLLTSGDPCTSDVDTTGYAEQALLLDPAAGAQVLAASQYLLGAQRADGGWTGASSTTARDADANSTALAVEALVAGPPAALAPRIVSAPTVAKGQALLASLQHADGALQISAAEKPASDDVLATDQAVPAIAGATLTTLLHRVSLAGTTSSPTPPVPSTPVATGSAVPVPTGSAVPVPTAGGTLPFTGTDASLWTELAAVLLAAGGGLLAGGRVLRRRRGHHH